MSRERVNHKDSLVLLNEQSCIQVKDGKVKFTVLPVRKKIWKDALMKHELNRPKKAFDL